MKILAIEDNPGDFALIQAQLIDRDDTSFEVLNARTLAAAQEHLKTRQIDFILLDLGLPDSQGIDTLRKIREISSSLPVIVLTGLDDEDTGLEALHEGAQDYLVKGQHDDRTLIRSIRYAEERNRIEQELIRKNIHLDALNEELVLARGELDRNIGELRQKEQELLAGEEKYRSLFMTVTEGVILYEIIRDMQGTPRDYRVIEMNPAAKCLMARPLPDQPACTIRTLFPDLKPEWFGLISRVVLTGKPLRTVIYLEPVSRHLEIFAFRPQAGRISILFHDISDRVRTENALRKSNQDLEQFAYIASHDLREPLRMVTLFSQLLHERYKGKLDRDADEFIDYIVDGGVRMDRLVEDLLEYSRVTSRAKPFKDTDMNKVVADARTNLSLAVSESGAEIEVGRLPVVSADGTQLTQVFQNLIGNSIKFRSDAVPLVRIDASSSGDSWVFSVRDNGIGIDPEYAEKIFEIFQRLHTRDKYPGTGIGLALCRRIIERHGGRIWVEPVKGSGSTFLFTLPGTNNPVPYPELRPD